METCAQCASQSSLRRCTGCFDVWYCSRNCQKKHWNQHRTTCAKPTPRSSKKQATVSEGRDRRCRQCGSRFPRLRRCMGCLAAWYCSVDCQGQHWPQHRDECSASKGTEPSGKRTVETCVTWKRTVERNCVQCASQSNLRRCTGCLTVWYCSKECQKQHWGLHKADCKKKKEVETLDSSETCPDEPPASGQELARYGEYHRFPPWLAYFCQSCGHRGKSLQKCERCHQDMIKEIPATDTEEACYVTVIWKDFAKGPIHPPIHVNSRQAEAARRTAEAKRLAQLRNENCRLTNQHDDDDVIVTPILTWEEARSRASRLFPGKRIVDMFRELDNDLLALPDCQNDVSISKIKRPYDHEFRVARHVQDFEGKSVYMICYNEEDPEPYFRYDQLVEGNFFCIDHAHLHIFADRSVGFRVDYPWDVHIMEP